MEPTSTDQPSQFLDYGGIYLTANGRNVQHGLEDFREDPLRPAAALAGLRNRQ